MNLPPVVDVFDRVAQNLLWKAAQIKGIPPVSYTHLYAMSGEFTVQAMSTVVLQIAPVTAKDMADVNANIDQICDWMERAVGGFPGVDLIVTPEFGCQGIGPDWKNVLLDLDSPEVGRLLAKCKELNVWGVFSVLVKEYGGHKARNMAILVNNQGEIALKYCKMNQFVPVDWSCLLYTSRCV